MKALRWATPVLLVVEVVLVLSGRLSIAAAAAVLVAVEAALAFAALGQAVVAVRGYRASRRAGAAPEAAFDASVRAALPGPLAAVVLHEVRLIQSLVLWVRRREHGVPPGAIAIRYGRDGRALGLMLLAVSVVEMIVVELVVPWPAVRLVLLVLGVYGLLIVLAFIVDEAVRPHVLTNDALRLRVGTWADVTLPLDSVTGVRRHVRSADGLVAFTADSLALATGNQTQLEVDLDQARELRAGRRSGSARTVRFSADDPAAAAAAIAAAVRAHSTSAPPGTSSRQPDPP